MYDLFFWVYQLAIQSGTLHSNMIFSVQAYLLGHFLCICDGFLSAIVLSWSRNNHTPFFLSKYINLYVDGSGLKSLCLERTYFDFHIYQTIVCSYTRHSQVSTMDVLVGTVTCVENRRWRRTSDGWVPRLSFGHLCGKSASLLSNMH